MGNFTETNLRPNSAILCHYGANIVHNDVKFVPTAPFLSKRNHERQIAASPLFSCVYSIVNILFGVL